MSYTRKKKNAENLLDQWRERNRLLKKKEKAKNEKPEIMPSLEKKLQKLSSAGS